MTGGHPGLGLTDYARLCEVLSLDAVPCAPLERAERLPAWMTAALIEAPAARKKLATWARETPGPWPQLEPADVLAHLAFHGDRYMAHTIARLLAALPRPVTDYVLANVTFCGVGWQMLGYCGPPPARRPWQIVLSGVVEAEGLRQFECLAVHEICHAWTLPTPGPNAVAATVLWDEAVLLTPIADVPVNVAPKVKSHRHRQAQAERWVDRLMAAWGFDDVRALVPGDTPMEP